MTEGGESPKISKFDALVIALKRGLKRRQEEGQPVEETPAMDEYLEKKKQEAGSPPPDERT